MARRPIVLVATLALAASGLSGCVAAAIPVIAGGLLVEGAADGDASNREDMATALPARARVDAPVGSASTPVAPAGETPPTAMAENVEPATPPAADETGDNRISAPTTTMAATPPVLRETPGTAEPLSLRAYDAFYSYVEAQARRDPVEQARDSALLAAPGLLRPDRTDCAIRPPAVIVDLDPGDGALSPPLAPQRNPALGQMLASLRLQEIEIFWVSSLPAVEAGSVRRALATAGLDPSGDDQLLLMRNRDDRKQERRREVAASHCVVAIAGDVRADFDELYLYLMDRDAAQPLEALVGAGWFLTPLPLQEGF